MIASICSSSREAPEGHLRGSWEDIAIHEELRGQLLAEERSASMGDRQLDLLVCRDVAHEEYQEDKTLDKGEVPEQHGESQEDKSFDQDDDEQSELHAVPELAQPTLRKSRQALENRDVRLPLIRNLLTSHKGRGDVTEGARNDDIIIPIMGPTGVGKSSMINQLAGKVEVMVGHGLFSCTAEIKHVIVQHPTKENRRIILVDTPGFDDIEHDDVEILKSIADWLTKSYGEGMKIAGIVYLHDISQSLVMESVRRNFSMFRKLCGDEALKHVVLATTKWDDVTPEVGQQREIRLRENCWGEMIQYGSVVMQVGTDPEHSPWKVIDKILTIESVLIQRELVELQKIIPQTKAGGELRYTLQRILEKREGKESLSKEDRDALVRQISQLKVPLGVRIKTLLGV